MEKEIMSEKDLVDYKNYVARLQPVDLIFESNKYQNALSPKRKAIDEEIQRRKEIVNLDDFILETRIQAFDHQEEYYKKMRLEYKYPYIYYLMKYELNKREESKKNRTI